MKAIKFTFIIAIVASLGALAAFSTRKADTNTNTNVSLNAGLNASLNANFEAKDKRFKNFLAKFPKQKMPMEINPNMMKQYQITNKNLSDEVIIEDGYADFLPTLKEKDFGRMPMQGRAVAVAKIKEGKDFVAVLYANSTTYEYNTQPPYVNMIIATFDRDGKLINEENVASLGGGYSYATATISKNLSISTRNYDYTYEKNAQEVGIENNKITGSTLTKQANFILASNGTFTSADDMRELKDESVKSTSSKETAAEGSK